MLDDKRDDEKPVPEQVKNNLDNAPLAELHTIEVFGWTLKYIPRPFYQERVDVVMNRDGRLNLESDINTRE